MSERLLKQAIIALIALVFLIALALCPWAHRDANPAPDSTNQDPIAEECMNRAAALRHGYLEAASIFSMYVAQASGRFSAASPEDEECLLDVQHEYRAALIQPPEGDLAFYNKSLDQITRLQESGELAVIKTGE